MADYTVTIDLSDHKRGDKWPGIPSIGPVLINGAQPASALARIRAQFRRGAQVFTLDSNGTGDALITILDAATWEATVPAIAQFLPTAGIWAWDMEFYATGEATPLTLYKGSIGVLDDITK